MNIKAGTLLFLDAGILSLLAHPRGGEKARAARAWARGLLEGGVRLWMAEVTDFEVRRELRRVGATASLRALDELRGSLDFAPMTTPGWLLAADLWAESRGRGKVTCDPKELDCDVLLAALALTAAGPTRGVAVASPNGRHLGQFLEVADWTEIRIFPRPSSPPPLKLVTA